MPLWKTGSVYKVHKSKSKKKAPEIIEAANNDIEKTSKNSEIANNVINNLRNSKKAANDIVKA